jgi:hypothetical protein
MFNITFSEIELSSLHDLISTKVQQLQRNQMALINAIFEDRKKILFASLGFKSNFIRGWHTTKPYSNQDHIKQTGKDLRANTSALFRHNIEIKSLTTIFDRIKINVKYAANLEIEDQSSAINEKWNELIELLSGLGHSKSQKEWEERLERIYFIWDHEEKTIQEKFRNKFSE